MKPFSGLDILLQKKILSLKNKNVGLLAHPASVNAQLIHTLTLLQKNKIHVTHLFGPEHGLWGEAQDMEGVNSETDNYSGLPVTSLYGSTIESLKPNEKDLQNIDVLVCDLQDIGSRYYTFIYTMALCMEACAKLGKEVVVIDRPNPINGLDVEGPLLQKGFESFVGLYAGLPVRHGMTIGELAHFFNEEFKMDCNLHVVKMKKWNRKNYFDETTLPWVLPSPNMPTMDTAVIYPGACLIEATEISEARGTTKPFELIGAPFIDAHQLADQLNNLRLPGILFRPAHFKPGFQKYKDQNCNGVQQHVTHRKIFKPYLTGVAVLKTIIDLYPNNFKWREKPYEFVKDIPAIDLLSGSDKLRRQLENHTSLKIIQKGWAKDEKTFIKNRKKYLLY